MGGQTYAGGGEDTIVREYVKAVQPNSHAQVAQQGRLTQGSRGWADLDDSQHYEWTQAVAILGIKGKGKGKGVRRQKP